MVKYANAHAGEDKRRRELVEAKHNADELIRSAERTLSEHGSKVPKGTRDAVQNAIRALNDTLGKDNAEQIRAKGEDLARASVKINEGPSFANIFGEMFGAARSPDKTTKRSTGSKANEVAGSNRNSPEADSAARHTPEASRRPSDASMTYEVALAWVKTFRTKRGDVHNQPTCFLSYAWGDHRHERWVEQLADHLEQAGVTVIFDRWHNTPGTSVIRFIERIAASDFVCPIGTPRYRIKDQASDTDPVARAELQLINSKLEKRDEIRDTVIPLLCDGTPQERLPLFEREEFQSYRFSYGRRISSLAFLTSFSPCTASVLNRSCTAAAWRRAPEVGITGRPQGC